jgi:hypothetical protein
MFVFKAATPVVAPQVFFPQKNRFSLEAIVGTLHAQKPHGYSGVVKIERKEEAGSEYN